MRFHKLGKNNWHSILRDEMRNKQIHQINRNPIKTILVMILFILVLTGCHLPYKNHEIPTSTEPVASETPVIQITATPEISKSAIIFVADENANAGIVDFMKTALTNLAGDSFNFQETASLKAEDIPTGEAFVFFASEPENLSDLAQNRPDVQFAVIGSEQSGSGNIWPVQYDRAWLPFLGGYALAISAYDWRSAILVASDSKLYDEKTIDVFTNGAKYFCGNCKSSNPPYNTYPVIISLPSTSTDDDWNKQIDAAQNQVLQTYYITELAGTQARYQKLSEQSVYMIGEMQPPEGFDQWWLATINFDWAATFNQVIEKSRNKESSAVLSPVLSIVPGKLPEKFSEGKKLDIQKRYEELLSGYIDPYDAAPGNLTLQK